ncbi:F-box only protein 16 isoform X5 [Mesocricetus auratus]|uniref:F-box only protein 16 isoform X5 n=1 Tax=Mesocricetus auratus TaxID=10036 RepID=A0A3Q0CZ27_MESAU|nr:F-box only protein 16 isoform X5 [Mesocricetus auratus]
MMAFAPPKTTDGSKMQTKMSTWTPLNHRLLNDQVFEERRALLGKWVSWHWKNLAELDQLWMLKCLRFNWYISFSPTPFEQGVWKKHYIQMVRELHITKPKTPPKDGFIVADVQPIPGSSLEEKQSSSLALRSSSSLRRKNNPGEKELPPWRSSDKHPTDIIRFNYLDNCDPEHFWQGRRKRKEVTPDLKRQVRDKKNKLEDRARLRKAQSLMSLSSHPKVPVGLNWPLHLPVGPSDPEAVTRILMEHFPNHPGLRSPPSGAPESTLT